MASGPDGNGLTAPGAYTSRTNTWAAGDQVASADLNDIQDGIIDVSDELDGVVGQLHPNSSATRNSSDSPAPTVHGGRTIWIEADTDTTTVVVLDTSIDWRDRYLEVALMLGLDNSGSAAYYEFPGDTDDDEIYIDLVNTTTPVGLHLFCYTEQGQDGTATGPGINWAPGPVIFQDNLLIFARSTDGALCMCLDGSTTSDNFRLTGRVTCSPMQNHY